MRKIHIAYFALAIVCYFIVACSSGSNNSESNSDDTQPKIVGKEISYATDSTKLQGYIVLDESISEKSF